MGQTLSYLRLVKLLNSAPNHTLQKELVLTALETDESSLNKVISEVNSFSNLISLNEDTLCLSEKVDLLDDMSIFKRVSGSGRIAILDKIDSTNSFMMQNAKNIASGDVVIAELQENGRGSRGGKWYSSFGKQLTLSLCYVFDSIDKIQGLSVGIGVAVAQSIERFGFEDILLKWPNDIYRGHKKLGGMLIESVPYQKKFKVIIGVGINVYNDQFKDLDREYACMFDNHIDSFKRNDLAAALINNIKKTCYEFSCGNTKMILEAFKARDELLGKNINVETVSGTYTGRAAGIDAKGALLLAVEDKLISLNTGHITYNLPDNEE